MNNQSRLRLLLCGVLAVAMAPVQAQPQKGPHPALPSVTVPGALGVNIHFTDAREGELEMLKAGGFRVIRMDFAWGATEKAKGVYDFSAYDRLIKSLDTHKLQPLFILDYSNELYDEGLSPYTDAGRTAFANWAGAAAKHFKGHKVLWEMYNEPNGGFWKPLAKVEDYIKLAVATGKAIQRDAPGECYIGPGVSGMDFGFMEPCFKAGLLELWDGVTVHPYRQSDPESVNNEYRRLRLMIERYKPKDKTIPILSGEWGYSSAWTNFDDERQGKYLPRQWMINMMNNIPVSIWYDWHDDGTDPKEYEHHFGSTENQYFAGRTPVYNPKPSYTAAKTLAQFLDGYKFNKRLSLDSPAAYLLVFSKGNEVKLAAWTTSPAHEIVIPASAGNFKVVNYLGATQPNAIATAQGLKVRISDAPIYLEPSAPNAALREIAEWKTEPLEVIEIAPVMGALGARAGRKTTRVPGGLRRDNAPVPLGYSRQFGPEKLWASQTYLTVVGNPLNISVMPVESNKLEVRLENPSEFPTVGEVIVNGGPAQTVSFTDSEKLLIFPFPARSTDGSWEAKVRYKGTTERDIVEATYRFVPVKSFAALTADNLAASLVANPDGDAKIESEQSLSLENAPQPAPNGGPVLKLKYRFAPGWKFANIQPRTNQWATIEGSPKRLGMWVYGDSSNHRIRMRFSDSTGQTFQPAGTPIDWTGWRYYSFPLDNTGGYWSGANDGQIHGAIKVESLFLLDSAEQKGGQGEIYVSSPSWIY
ncbi:hypothetical protein EON83_20435 [bacterium]|nr:MAG: hypothetical protein EON83_20435 [bacterium]